MCNQTNDVIHVYFGPHRLPRSQNNPNSGTRASQHFLFIDNRRKIKSRKTRFMRRPPLSRLRRRFAPLRGTQRRCAALRAAPPGRYAPRALRAQPFCKHEKNAELSPPNLAPRVGNVATRFIWSVRRRRLPHAPQRRQRQCRPTQLSPTRLSSQQTLLS